MRSCKVFVVLSLIAIPYSFAQFSDPQVHVGTTFVASVDRSIRASHAKAGDGVEFRVAQPFLLGGEVVPRGTKISGHVVLARKLDKKAKLESLLAIVADRIAWKKRSFSVKAWIVGFGSIKVSKTDRNNGMGGTFGARMAARMAETTDRPMPPSTKESLTASDSTAGNITYDPAAFVGDIRILRKPSKDIGTVLVHDDGDIDLPKTLLVMLEQIDINSGSH